MARVRIDNNAALLARRIYLTDLELFDRVWERENHDLRKTIERVIGLAKDADDPYAAVKKWLGETWSSIRLASIASRQRSGRPNADLKTNDARCSRICSAAMMPPGAPPGSQLSLFNAPEARMRPGVVHSQLGSWRAEMSPAW